MNDGILSQEEIDALLSGGGKSSSPEPLESDNSNSSAHVSLQLSDFERDALGEIGNISMGTSATILSTLLRRKVAITTPAVSVTSRDQIQAEYPEPYVIVEVEYREGLQGSNLFVLKEDDARIIAELMMGMEPQKEYKPLSEIELSAVSEAMNQMMGSSTTSLSTMFNTRIDISPPQLTLVNLSEDNLKVSSDYEELVRIKFRMVIEELVDSEIMQIIPIEAVRTMLAMLTGGATQEETAPVPEPDPLESIAELLQEAPAPSSPAKEEPVVFNTGMRAGDSEPAPARSTPYTVQPVQFSSLQAREIESMPQNIGLIMDVPLDVSVELGKARKTIKDILELQQGSIIQLDKMAGEPVDLVVNGKLVARGEVVVIDENYGIRITAIISPMDRVNKLQ